MENFNKEDHIAQFTESIIINLPIEVKYVKEKGGATSIYIPEIDTYSYVKNINDIEDVKHKINAF